MHAAICRSYRPIVGRVVLPSPTDDSLLKCVSSGDRAGLDELFRRHRSVAFRIAYRLLGNEADALDAVQDGFVRALRNLAQFQGRSSFRTWLLRVVSSAALDIGRQRRRNARFPFERMCRLERSEPPADTELACADLRERVDAALAQLPEPQRQVFVLHTEGDLAYREIAHALGVSIGTVMSRLFYARQKLKSLLVDQAPA